MDKPKKYCIPEDSVAVNAAEPIGAYNVHNRQIVLTIPQDTDADIVRNRVGEFYAQLLKDMADEQEFVWYRQNWEKETRFVSDPYKIISNQYFLSIVGMGKRAIPYIVNDIEQEPSFLFVALELICGQRIAKVEKQGHWGCINVSECCAKWIERLKK